MQSVTRLLLGLIPALIWPAIAEPQAGTDFNLSEIADGIYLHQGVTVPFEHPQHDDVANLGFVVGDDCVAVIDTGGSLSIGRALRDAVRHTTDKPVCYVINTHVHPDHTLGNAAFQDDEPVFVGHARLPGAFEHNRQFFSENFAAELEHRDPADTVIPPDRLVADTLTLDLGGRELRIDALDVGHTDQDLAIFDSRTATLWLGSLFNERVPAIDGDAIGWVESMETLRSIPAKLVVPGNGPAPALWPQSVDAQQRYLKAVIEGVRDVLARDGFLEEALASVAQTERGKWLLFDQHHGANVTRVYTDLEWE